MLLSIRCFDHIRVPFSLQLQSEPSARENVLSAPLPIEPDITQRPSSCYLVPPVPNLLFHSMYICRSSEETLARMLGSAATKSSWISGRTCQKTHTRTGDISVRTPRRGPYLMRYLTQLKERFVVGETQRYPLQR